MVRCVGSVEAVCEDFVLQMLNSFLQSNDVPFPHLRWHRLFFAPVWCAFRRTRRNTGSALPFLVMIIIIVEVHENLNVRQR